MQAEIHFDKEHVEGMPLTMEFTATYREWLKLKQALDTAQKAIGNTDPLTPINHCITNLIDAVNDATGQGYKTRGYSFEYQPTETDS